MRSDTQISPVCWITSTVGRHSTVSWDDPCYGADIIDASEMRDFTVSPSVLMRYLPFWNARVSHVGEFVNMAAQTMGIPHPFITSGCGAYLQQTANQETGNSRVMSVAGLNRPLRAKRLCSWRVNMLTL